MDFAGDAAASTLGFIVGDVPGAYAAHQAYRGWIAPRFLTKNKERMARTKYSYPKRKASSAMSAGKGKRKKSISPSESRSTRRNSLYGSSASRSSMSIGNGSNMIAVRSVKTKSQGVKKEGIKKGVKVPKLLRKQVRQVLDGGYQNYGTFMETQSEKIAPNDFGQSVRSVGYLSENIRQHFDPNFVLHAASVLFNGKAGKLNPVLIDTDNFNTRTTKIRVLKQSCSYRFKNNTARTMYLKMYSVSPKGKLPTIQDDAATYWANAMLADTGNAIGISAAGKLNINSATPATLYCTPYVSKAFMNNYTVDCSTVILEAGKTWNYTITGPNMKDYEFSKYWDPSSVISATDFQNQQKFIKQCFISVYYDLAGTDTGAATRKVEGISNNTAYGLVIETTNYIKLAMPDTTGWNIQQTPVGASQNASLTNRRTRPYYLQDWTQQATGAAKVINDNVPNAPTTAGT